jgi:hypothetical protein
MNARASSQTNTKICLFLTASCLMNCEYILVCFVVIYWYSSPVHGDVTNKSSANRFVKSSKKLKSSLITRKGKDAPTNGTAFTRSFVQRCGASKRMSTAIKSLTTPTMPPNFPFYKNAAALYTSLRTLPIWMLICTPHSFLKS